MELVIISVTNETHARMLSFVKGYQMHDVGTRPYSICSTILLQSRDSLKIRTSSNIYPRKMISNANDNSA